ncbi:MAG: N-acetylmuramoyl-L-alanine amidase family protein [Alphaproteobacteria bacterium]
MSTSSCQVALAAVALLLAILPDSSRAARSSRSSGGDGSSITVVIDAGHGGHDRGGIPGQRVAEKEMTLDVARRLAKVLSSGGYRVVMTRDSDVFVSLGARVAIANSYRNAIFVCIHFNATGRRGASGIETYFYDHDSLPLASAIHYYVAGGAPSDNRGVRRRGYYVLRKTRIPAVLVECGFLTNPTEAAYAQSSSYRQKLAEEIAAGIYKRNSVTRTSTRVATAESVPLQPYIDQTKVSRSSHRHSKRSHTRSARKKKNSSKRSSSKKRTKSSDQEG